MRFTNSPNSSKKSLSQSFFHNPWGGCFPPLTLPTLGKHTNCHTLLAPFPAGNGHRLPLVLNISPVSLASTEMSRRLVGWSPVEQIDVGGLELDSKTSPSYSLLIFAVKRKPTSTSTTMKKSSWKTGSSYNEETVLQSHADQYRCQWMIQIKLQQVVFWRHFYQHRWIDAVEIMVK